MQRISNKLSFRLNLIIFITISFQFNYLIAQNLDTVYTDDEKISLEKLKESSKDLFKKDYHFWDSYLIHFLRAKNLDVAATRQLLINNFKWREDNKIDSILSEPNLISLESKLPFSLKKKDRNGRPIVFYEFGKWDVRKIVLSGRSELFKRYLIYILEKGSELVHKLRRKGQDVSQFVILIDVNGFNRRQHACLPCFSGIGDLINLLEQRYPSMSAQHVFINTPRAFQTFLSIIKSSISPERRHKLQAFGYDKNEWNNYLGGETIDH